jgi:hypothetical protein
METRKKDSSLIFLFVEGESTEYKYFKAFASWYSSPGVQLRPVASEGGKSAIVHLVDKAINEIENGEFQEGDQIWVVADTDHQLKQGTLETQIERGSKNGIQFAISNPCFELWFWLHLADWDVENVELNTCKKLSKKLNELYAENRIGSYFEEKFLSHLNSAVSRAIDLDNLERVYSFPSTGIFLLIKAIDDLSKKKQGRNLN